MVSFKWDPEVAMKVRVEEAWENGINKGRKDGIMQTTLSSIRSLMKKLHMTAAEAMNVLEIPANEQEKYASQL